MAAKPAPAPWRVSEVSPCRILASDRVLAEVYRSAGEGEASATAALMARAPALLHACELARAWFTATREALGEDGAAPGPALQEVKAALEAALDTP